MKSIEKICVSLEFYTEQSNLHVNNKFVRKINIRKNVYLYTHCMIMTFASMKQMIQPCWKACGMQCHSKVNLVYLQMDRADSEVSINLHVRKTHGSYSSYLQVPVSLSINLLFLWIGCFLR